MSSTSEIRPQAIVEIADLYVVYYRDDLAFAHIMGDPRAREVTEADVRPLWINGDLRIEDARQMNAPGIFSLVSMHFWEHLIDFDYIDIGASSGLTVVSQAVFYKRLGRNNRIYAFEPGDVFLPLRETVRLNRLDDMTTCIRAAASDKAGQVEFHVLPTQSPGSSMLNAAVQRPGVEPARSIIVNAMRLDDFVSTIRPTAGLAIKVDTEGADIQVLRGMQNIMATKLAVIQIEFYPGMIDTYANPELELMHLTDRFELIEIRADGNSRIPAADISGFGANVRSRPTQITDVLLIPRALPEAEVLIARIVNN